MSSIETIQKLSLTDCISSFKAEILQNEGRIASLKKYSINSEVDQHKIRPMAWKVFLDILPQSKGIKEWIEEIAKQRAEYKKKLKTYCTIKKFSGDPLGNNNVVPKKGDPNFEKYTMENDMKKLINLDLSRTYQDMDLFLKTNTRNLLANILFIWSKENPDVSYHQGMNEILAVVFLAFYPYYHKTLTKPKPNKNDILSYLNSEESMNNNLKEIYLYFHDEEEIQADLYFVFSAIMKKGIKELYDGKVLDKNEADYKKFELFPNKWKDTSDEDVPTYVNRRCALLIKEKLKILDEELFSYFQRIDLSCNIFIQRWLRCLFNREFKYTEVFVLWDAIFANESSENKYDFIYMEYISIAMIFKLRRELLLLDQTECFTKLFKYPEVEHINEIVDIANRIKQAMADRIKGVETTVYEILFIPRPMNRSGISPHTYNQKEEKSSNGNFKKRKDSNPPAVTNESIASRRKKSGNDMEKQGSKFLGSALSSLNSLGGMIKDVGRKVGTTVSEKVNQIQNVAIAAINNATSGNEYENNNNNQYSYNNENNNTGYTDYNNSYNNNSYSNNPYNDNSYNNNTIYNENTNNNNSSSYNNSNPYNNNTSSYNNSNSYNNTSSYNNNEYTSKTVESTTYEEQPIEISENYEDNKDNKNPLVIIAKLKKYKRKYGMYMEKNDKDDLSEIIQFLSDSVC